jgi:hydrogenase-4 component F
MIELLLVIPVITALLCLLMNRRRSIEIVSTVGAGILFIGVLLFVYKVVNEGAIYEGALFMDSLSAYMLLIVSFMVFIGAVYSVGYMAHEFEEKQFGLGRLRFYYTFLHIFIFTMMLVCVSNNLGIMWIAIEATTLASAFLVGFYNRDTSIEAAWKYIIICSVGITLALLGIILAYASSVNVVGESSNALDWTTLRSIAGSLDKDLLRMAFILVLVGYGTKVGLAPMHTWLPDAHSQAPTPISALLSGVLLNCAMYGILRFHIISTEALGPGFSGSLLLLFGVVSMVIAAAFIIIARDIKRLLAYSSIEHMGIIAIGFGLGGPFGVFGALLHMLNHSLAKSLLFFGAGNVLLKLKTKVMEEVRGLGQHMAATAVLLFIGMLALAGSPPFGLFISELSILYAAVTQGQVLVAAMYLLLLAIIFAALLWHFGSMIFGTPAEEIPRGEVSRLNIWVMVVLAAGLLVLGLVIPGPLATILERATSLFGGMP